jgi:WS/DGAT/MGAT family acyltransferase
MQQLTGLDAAFLAMETRTVFGHVGSVCVIDPSTAPEPLTFERFTTAIEERLALIPVFRRRLVEVPFGLDQPYWIEDSHFDIEFHVRELALPSPGDAQQLAEQVARLHARPLDRSRPLWEVYLITGLEGGRAAFYSKVHHAAIDGVSGNDIFAAVLDLAPEGRPLPPIPKRAAEEPPNGLGLLARSAVSLAGHPLRATKVTASLLKLVPGFVSAAASAILPSNGRASDDDALLAQPGLRAPHTPFNATITQHRRVAFSDIPLADVKRIKNAAGLTVNDVVMTLCAGALRRWLTDHDALPATPLVSAVPVSVRTEDQQGTHGNRVSMMFAGLATHLSDPRNRLRASHEAMRAAKEQHGAIPASLLADVSQFAAPVLANQAWRLSARLRLLERVNPFNLIISNVPGPNIPLYCAGAQVLAYYPVSAITDGQGLNITVMSYRDTLHFGLIACRELVPDIGQLAHYLEEEVGVLTKAVEPTSQPAQKKTTPRAKAKTAKTTPARRRAKLA